MASCKTVVDRERKSKRVSEKERDIYAKKSVFKYRLDTILIDYLVVKYRAREKEREMKSNERTELYFFFTAVIKGNDEK